MEFYILSKENLNVRKIKMCRITVFTPTYNRAYIISKLYSSLKKQTFQDFEWLVVDDGSTDTTEELFKNWINIGDFFPIRYYKKENGGKCKAINYALDLAKGELFFTVDSDDYLTNDALEKIDKWINDLPKNDNYCGVAGNLGFTSNLTPNNLFSSKYYEGTLLDRYTNVKGERAYVFFTSLHRKYKYPEYVGENFMTEAVVYNRIAHDGYKIRFYNDIIWIYEYRDDGLTKAGHSLFINNPQGYGLWIRERLFFEKATITRKIRTYYAFTVELQNAYSSSIISKCIEVPVIIISIFKLIYKIFRIVKK